MEQFSDLGKKPVFSELLSHVDPFPKVLYEIRDTRYVEEQSQAVVGVLQCCVKSSAPSGQPQLLTVKTPFVHQERVLERV